MGVAMLSQFDTDILSPHLVGNCGGCARTEERIKNDIAWVAG
ncbi:hypothetical protein SDC9_196503 [bioreactor metagenome]|uniref:Uncharacterized protein n=1 Tax=bioreactor metagenome TaxID=1076179 RepID=A0A645IC12_9ZZZZ